MQAVPQDNDQDQAFTQTGSDGVNEDEPGQIQGREQEPQENEGKDKKSCYNGCEQCERSKQGWHSCLHKFPAYMNRHLNYKHTNWISTRELARKLDQQDQLTHHHSMEGEITDHHFILLDARGKKEYRTSHIHGAIHLPVMAHLCIFIRPGLGIVQNNFFQPRRNTPLVAAKDKPIFKLLQNVDKDTEIVVYCAVGYRSGWIASALTRQGYNVSCVYGGMYKWANEGREIFKFKSDDSKEEYSGHRKEHMKSKIRNPWQPKAIRKAKKKDTKGKRGRAMSGSRENLMSETTPDHATNSPDEFPNSAHGAANSPDEAAKSHANRDSQGMVAHPRHDEEQANKIAPHQFVAQHMLDPSLKPN